MTATGFILAALIILVIAIIANGLKIVQQSETMIIERLGKYYRTLSSGVSIIIPFIDKPRPIRKRIAYTLPSGQNVVQFKDDTLSLIHI